jgi:hypothetical protein
VLAQRRYGDRAWVGSLWFAAAVSAWLFTGRMPFLLAVPLALAAFLPRGGAWPLALAAVLAALSSLASPVAGLFVVVAGLALALAGERAHGAAVAVGAAVPIVVLNLAFPTGGEEPFVFSAFIAIPILAALVLWLVPPEQRALRIGAVLYVVLALVVFVVPNAVGGNVTRLGALLAGPVLAMVLWPRGRLIVAAVSIPLLYWQLIAPVRDVHKAAGDPATERAYFEPLNAELDRLADRDGLAFRTEIPPTKNRWEADYVAPEHPIARGWLRQLESDDFDLFTKGNLTAAAYRAWLAEHGVSYVAVADAQLDYLAEDEVGLIDGGLDYLKPVWSADHWRLYRVDGGPSLAGDGVDSVGPDEVDLTLDRAQTETIPVNWSRYWRVEAGDACVSEGDDGETVVEARSPGPVEVRASLSGDRCSG